MSCVLCPLSPMTEGGRQKTGKGSFDASLNGLHSFQAPSPTSKWTESDYQLVSLWPHQPSFLLHYTPMSRTQTLQLKAAEMLH